VRGMVVLLLVTSRPRTMSALGGGSAAGPSHSRRFTASSDSSVVGVKQIYRHRSNDAIDPHRTLDSIHSGETENSRIHFFGDQPAIGVISWRHGTDP
jgi:hypothetical protein